MFHLTTGILNNIVVNVMIQKKVLIAPGLTNLIKWPMNTEESRKPESVGRVKLNHKEKCQQSSHSHYFQEGKQ